MIRRIEIGMFRSVPNIFGSTAARGWSASAHWFGSLASGLIRDYASHPETIIAKCSGARPDGTVPPLVRVIVPRVRPAAMWKAALRRFFCATSQLVRGTRRAAGRPSVSGLAQGRSRR